MSNEGAKGIPVETVVKEILEQVFSKRITQRAEEIFNLIWAEIRELRGVGVLGKTYDEYSADELSKIQGRLALYKVDLGDIMAEMGRNYEFIKNQLDLRRGNIYVRVSSQLEQQLKKKPTVTAIKVEIERMCYREKDATLFWEEQYAKCLNLWRSLNTLLEAISTRCRIITSGMATISLADNADEIGLPEMSFGAQEKEMIEPDYSSVNTESSEQNE